MKFLHLTATFPLLGSLVQTDKFFVDEVGSCEGDIVPYLSVIPQLLVPAPASEMQNRASIPLS